MSRIGKKVITIPEKTTVKVADSVVTVSGPEGEISRTLHPKVTVSIDENEVRCAPIKEDIESRALWGTTASHISNMIKGVNNQFEKKLVVEGVGYKWEISGNDIIAHLGFSHPVKMKIPEGVTAKIEKNTLTLSGIDKEKVGQFGARIKALRKPEPYKGKGIRYEGEIIRRKEGKKTA